MPPKLSEKRQSRLLPKLKLALLLFVFAFYPGQNRYQLLSVTLSDSHVRGLSVDLGGNLIPYWNGMEPPVLTAQSAIVFDPDSGTLLYQKNIDSALPPASTTKIMTALIALDAYPLDQVLTVRTAPQVAGNKIKLVSGEQMTVHNLLYGMLVASANDAAVTLAENYPDGYDGFVAAMNRKAAQLNLNATHFSDVDGVGSADHYSSVHDLVILTKEAFKSDFFRQLVNTQTVLITDISGKNEYQLSSTNLLLGKVEGVSGVKTGWTEDAGECLVTYVERNGHRLFLAVLGSADRFGESEKLINWSYSAHDWRQLPLD